MILKKLLSFFFIISALFIIKSSLVLAQESGSVDILVQPISYISPFYKGLPMFPNQGLVRIMAMPNIVIGGQKISSPNLIFKWTEGGTVMGEDSGFGQDKIDINAGLLLDDLQIDLDVEDKDNNSLASNSVTIKIHDPKIIFYENSPLYGILFNRAVNYGYNLGEREELKIVAKPFFFSAIDDISNNINYSWSVNGTPVSLEGKKNELLLRQTNVGQSGIASVSLDVENSAKDFQSANGSFNVSFGK